jgi:flagellar motor switch/type III secretory pathway protein FliN
MATLSSLAAPQNGHGEPGSSSGQTAGAPGPHGNGGAGSAGGMATADGRGLVPAPRDPREREPIALTPQVTRLPVELDVSVPVRNFRVRNLLALEPSHLIESGWGHGDDLPLAAGKVQLAWSEFEVIETQLAVRVTRLA